MFISKLIHIVYYVVKHRLNDLLIKHEYLDLNVFLQYIYSETCGLRLYMGQQKMVYYDSGLKCRFTFMLMESYMKGGLSSQSSYIIGFTVVCEQTPWKEHFV